MTINLSQNFVTYDQSEFSGLFAKLNFLDELLFLDVSKISIIRYLRNPKYFSLCTLNNYNYIIVFFILNYKLDFKLNFRMKMVLFRATITQGNKKQLFENFFNLISQILCNFLRWFRIWFYFFPITHSFVANWLCHKEPCES